MNAWKFAFNFDERMITLLAFGDDNKMEFQKFTMENPFERLHYLLGTKYLPLKFNHRN